MSSHNSVINASQLCCTSGSQYLLQNISWQVHSGENWIVFGKNGCGKTTLLSIIAGYQKFTSGKLEVLGETYSEKNILQLRQKIGFISGSFFEKYYRNESVFDIVLAGLSGTLGVSTHITEKTITLAKELLTVLGLKGKIHAPFYLLSKGERQQVLIVRELLKNPQLLILDEPCVGLDVLARERLLLLLNKISKQKNKTIIYVTHYPEEIMPFFTECLLLRSGTLYHSGAITALFTSKVMTDFLNFPVSVTLQNERYHIGICDSDSELIPDILMEVLYE